MTRSRDRAEHAGHHYEDASFDDMLEFRVWPDGTVQCVEDGPPHSHMSDDYVVVLGFTEEEAVALVLGASK